MSKTRWIPVYEAARLMAMPLESVHRIIAQGRMASRSVPMGPVRTRREVLRRDALAYRCPNEWQEKRRRSKLSNP